MHHFLYIDTSSSSSLVMLFNEEKILSFRINEQQSNHGQVIHQQIEDMLHEQTIEMKHLNAVCVLNGPGSYTGLRISLSTAKGYCYACNIPLILINKLDLIHACTPPELHHQKTCVIIKARENEYFSAVYSADEQREGEICIQNNQELLNQRQDKGGILIAEDQSLSDDFSDLVIILPKMEQISQLCIKYFSASKHADLFSSEPFYLKNVFINKTNKL